MDNFCRCCARKCHPLEDIFRKNESGEEFADMLKIFTKIEIGTRDVLPRKICADCLAKLQAAHQFHLQMLQSQVALRNLLDQPQRKQAPPVILPKSKDVQCKCPNCSKEFEEETAFKTHLAEHFKKRRVFSCYECPSLFDSKKLLAAHIKTHLDKNICQFCNAYFGNGNSMESHKKESHSRAQYMCGKCSHQFSTRRNLVLHLKRTHGDCLYFCHDCGGRDEYRGKVELNDHITGSHPNDDKEEVAHQVDAPEEDLAMHEEFLDEFFLNEDNCFQLNACWDEISLSFVDDFREKTSHSFSDVQLGPGTRYRCPKCCSGFGRQFELKLHLAHEHDLQTLVCNFCGQAFNRMEIFKVHRSKHLQESNGASAEGEYGAPNCNGILGQNPITCTFFEQTFQNRREMYSHRKRSHPNEALQCVLCDKSFKTLLGLKYHLKVHSGSKDYCCPYCAQKFPTDINLNAHVRSVHSEVKAHVCNLCDRRFATTDHLRKHVTSVHQKERNFLCCTCGKGFAQSSHLKQHLLVHTGERRFQCSSCPKGFFKAADLSKHLAKNHPDCDPK